MTDTTRSLTDIRRETLDGYAGVAQSEQMRYGTTYSEDPVMSQELRLRAQAHGEVAAICEDLKAYPEPTLAAVRRAVFDEVLTLIGTTPTASPATTKTLFDRVQAQRDL